MLTNLASLMAASTLLTMQLCSSSSKNPPILFLPGTLKLGRKRVKNSCHTSDSNNEHGDPEENMARAKDLSSSSYKTRFVLFICSYFHHKQTLIDTLTCSFEDMESRKPDIDVDLPTLPRSAFSVPEEVAGTTGSVSFAADE